MSLKLRACLYLAVLLLTGLWVYAADNSNNNNDDDDSNLKNREAKKFLERLVRSPNPKLDRIYGIVYSHEGQPLGVLQVSNRKEPLFNLLHPSTLTAL